MPIPVSTSIVAMGVGWKSVGGQLLASAVLMLSGHQDTGLRSRVAAFFSFFMAIAFSVSALITAIRAGLLAGAAICVVVLCLEAWLVRHWWNRIPSA